MLCICWLLAFEGAPDFIHGEDLFRMFANLVRVYSREREGRMDRFGAATGHTGTKDDRHETPVPRDAA